LAQSPELNPSELLFVYGTLLPGLRLNHHMSGAERLGPAKAQGLLYDLGTYPGWVQGEGWVSGEIYRLSSTHLLRLDEVEEVVPGDPDASLYVRDRIQISEGTCSGQWVWIYRYNRPVTGCFQIQSGDYLEHIRQTPGRIS
jgi:gamma-glutamylcyclotransferase (GGCT)/AIG2-like uncharacterized protein YtfP